MQRRLDAAGFEPATSDAGVYCASTTRAVREFQTARGLRPSGLCDQLTWLTLVEASWRPGDRLLKLSAPQMRGDDVDQLQVDLARLGFDCGRPDGIYGPATVRAVQRFQRHIGLRPDGICGPDTVRALQINSRQTGDGPGVAALRELVQLSTVSPTSENVRIVVGQFGGLSSLSRQVARALRQRGASVVSTDEPDATAHAAVANQYEAMAYLGFEASTDRHSTISYYSVPTFESVGGRSLAASIVRQFACRTDVPVVCELHGMRLPVLRETRMPAVLCSFGSILPVLTAAPTVTDAIVGAVLEWTRAPLPQPSEP